MATPQEGDAGTCVSAAVVTGVQSGVLCAFTLEGCWVGEGGAARSPVLQIAVWICLCFDHLYLPTLKSTTGTWSLPWWYLPVWVHPQPTFGRKLNGIPQLPLPCHHRTAQSVPTHARMNECVYAVSSSSPSSPYLNKTTWASCRTNRNVKNGTASASQTMCLAT